ncbi:MAG: DUF1513 domain-containing protein [Azoarcus sp.]|nr:DUF1513 domain-containing protein [Azoarcus sp.]
MHRREFLAGLASLALPLPALSSSTVRGTPEDRPRAVMLAAAADAGGPFFTAVDGATLRTPGRGHGMLPLPNVPELILVARRPGYWMWRVNWRSGQALAKTIAAPDRHFFGHAILSPDGRSLFTTENNIATGQGLIGIYDSASLTRLGEIPSHGIGPHELLWLDPGKVLAVANGGILTLPETGRLKLNLEHMAPSVVLIDMPSGRLMQEHILDDRSLSLRHLARCTDGTLGIAIQAESPDGREIADAPLLAILRDGRLSLAEAPPGLGGYGASIVAHDDRFLVTALQSDTIVQWSSHGDVVRETGLRRPAGLATVDGQVLVSNELGTIARLDPDNGRLTAVIEAPGIRWDNHLAIVRHS